MSDHHTAESSNPIASLIGTIFLILVPFSLVVMLGFVGAALIKGGGYKAPPPKPVAAAPAPAPKTKDTGAAKTTPEAPAADQSVLLKDNGPPTAEQLALGKTNYATCAACHGMDGKGMQVGPQKMAPSFEGSELLLGNVEAPLVAVLKGIHKDPGSSYVGQMMALGAGLSDEQIAAVLTYARNSFGNTASAISVEQAAAARAKYATVNKPMGLPRADLEKIARGK